MPGQFTEAQMSALIQELKKRLGLIKHFAKLGDSDDLQAAVVNEPGRPGFVRVRLEIDDVPYRVVKSGLLGAYSPNPGSAVIVGYDEKGDLAIEKADHDAIVEANGNPLIYNSGDPAISAFNQTDGLLPLFCGAVSATQGTLTNEVFINPWRFANDSNVVQAFPGALIDLTALVPGANLHRYVAIFLKMDDLTIEIAGSTPIATITPLQDTDKQECFSARSDRTTPIALWRLENSQTVVTNANKIEDIRPWLPTPKIAGTIGIRNITPATVDDVQDYIDNYGSAGLLGGGVMTDATGEEVAISDMVAMLREANDHNEPLYSFDLSSIANQAIATDTFKYIGVEWNSGSPQIVLKDTDTWNFHTEFPLGNVTNEATTLHILNNPQRITNFGAHTLERFYETQPFQRANRIGGILLGESGTRNVTLSAGEFYDRLSEFPIAAIDTNVAGSFDVYYQDGIGGFTKVAAQTQWDNTQYDDGSGVLATMTNNRWASIWWYVEPNDGNLVAQYGRAQFTTEAACLSDDTIPGTAPNRLVLAGKLIGRFIFQKSAATVGMILSEFSTSSTPSAVSDHNLQGGLQGGTTNEYYHLTSAEHTALSSVAPRIPQARISVSSTLSVPTSDVTGTTIYVLPHGGGDKITVYDGAAWVEFTLASAGISISNAGLAIDTNYDLYVYDNSGLTIELVAWTNDTTRATALAQQDEYDVKSGDDTRFYMGAIRTYDGGGGTVTFADVGTGGGGSIAAPARRLVSNRYNRVPREIDIQDDIDSTTTSTTSIEAWHQDTNNRADIVNCIDQEPVDLKFSAGASSSGTAFTFFNIGLAATTKHAKSKSGFGAGSALSTAGTAVFESQVGIGKRSLYLNQVNSAATSNTIFGDSAFAALQFGASGHVWG